VRSRPPGLVMLAVISAVRSGAFAQKPTQSMV